MAASLGGGSFEIQQINDFELNISGGYFELLIFTKGNQLSIDHIKSILLANYQISKHSKGEEKLINVKSSEMFLQRDGKLIKTENGFKLIVECKAQDVLLDKDEPYL